ncbi:hypothetical protein [Lysinibacillus fusiformis]|uniref:hypothetical protein n=1 Tax=Lysinibacillus fusiformis TaxID=28031 RepID=UPI00263BADAB|nr:hypothetical protein [Lysinibacillus fusiformis]MDC6267275.1 hypothetical protein [Lysinibacillus sphaericus]MDN4968291.1 hypothetical protein [Lysinibacillus fusiformis]MDN4968465.1 hypothetical protein [Lysinibacillus fusiformis]
MKSKEEVMSDQAVEMRDLIPDYVDGKCTESMACSPTEVFYFANLYIKELQDKNKRLMSALSSTCDSLGADISDYYEK